MANANVSFAGQVNGAGDPRALWLKVWAGEVLTAFLARNVFAERHMTRSITSGKSASFPATGTTTAEYHTPGTEITGDIIDGNERVVTIDDLLVSPVFIANVDEALAHFDIRGEYTQQCGYALAKAYDQNIAQVAVLAARAAATVTGLPGGLVITDAASATLTTAGGNALVQDILTAQAALDTNNVPDEDRFIFVGPLIYWNLFNADKITNRDFTFDDNGSIASGKILRIGGIPVVKTNHMPTTNVTTGPTAYQGNFTTTSAIVMHKSAVGTVKLIDLAIESAYDVRRQGTLIVSKYLVGHGILRPESAVEVKTS
jgi:hypothetical protein